MISRFFGFFQSGSTERNPELSHLETALPKCYQEFTFEILLIVFSKIFGNRFLYLNDLSHPTPRASKTHFREIRKKRAPAKIATKYALPLQFFQNLNQGKVVKNTLQISGCPILFKVTVRIVGSCSGNICYIFNLKKNYDWRYGHMGIYRADDCALPSDSISPYSYFAKIYKITRPHRGCFCCYSGRLTGLLNFV